MSVCVCLYLEHQYLVGVYDGREAVSHYDGGLPLADVQ